MRTLALLLTDANEPWFGGVSQSTDPQTAKKVSYTYCQSNNNNKKTLSSPLAHVFSVSCFSEHTAGVFASEGLGWLQEPGEDAFSHIF